MYDQTRQYRCTIIRGKSKNKMDDLLPAYAMTIDGICPCPVEDFDQLFNNAFRRFLTETDSKKLKKTLDNHRTEISGKLFGMYYRAADGMVYESQRTLKYLEDNDQPAFFKDICYKMQFPNGMDSTHTLQQRLADKICVRPNSFVLKLLQVAENANQHLTVRDIGYYVLNSLDVLQGKASPYEVLEAIVKDRKAGIRREIKAFNEDGTPKEASFTTQHIREQLNYLELANLIRIGDDKRVVLNPRETAAIEVFAADYNKPLEFDVYSYNLASIDGRRDFQYDWDIYFARLSENAALFATETSALTPTQDAEEGTGKKNSGQNLTEFGDEGEALVYNYEKKRVQAYNFRLANKVLSLGKTKGLGYDIQSVVAEPGDYAEFVKYIEVKSTKLYTCPDIDDPMWIDTLTMTRNEWVAAKQHGQYYSIARVYFTGSGVTMFILENVAEKMDDGRMSATPMNYRVDFSSSSVDRSVALQPVV